MVEENRVYSFPDHIVPPEGEGEVAYTSTNSGIRQVCLDPPGGIHKVHSIIIMLLNTCTDGQDIRIKDYIARWELELFCKQFIGSFTDFNASFIAVGLTLFIKGHNNNSGPVSPDKAGMFQELFLAFFQTDGVDHCLALDAFQACLYDCKFRRVDHKRNLGNFRFSQQKIQEGMHLMLRIQHSVIQVNIQDLCAIFHLSACYLKGLVIYFFTDQASKLPASGHIATLPDIDEIGSFKSSKGLQTTQGQSGYSYGRPPDLHLLGQGCKGPDMLGRGSAAPSHDIYKSGVDKFLDQLRHIFGRFVILPELVG